MTEREEKLLTIIKVSQSLNAALIDLITGKDTKEVQEVNLDIKQPIVETSKVINDEIPYEINTALAIFNRLNNEIIESNKLKSTGGGTIKREMPIEFLHLLDKYYTKQLSMSRISTIVGINHTTLQTWRKNLEEAGLTRKHLKELPIITNSSGKIDKAVEET